MDAQKMQKAVLVTRSAELEAVSLAIGRSRGEDALRTLRCVAETMGSSKFEAVVWQARKKIENAVASCLSP